MSPEIALLRKCREQFAKYGVNHRTKADAALSRGENRAAIEKAEVNEAFVIEIDALIGPPEAVR
jgi:hypothetical protein